MYMYVYVMYMYTHVLYTLAHTPSHIQCIYILISSPIEFYGIELWVLQRAIQSLAREGKAELIPGDSVDGSDAGVKFFS